MVLVSVLVMRILSQVDGLLLAGAEMLFTMLGPWWDPVSTRMQRSACVGCIGIGASNGHKSISIDAGIGHYIVLLSTRMLGGIMPATVKMW